MPMLIPDRFDPRKHNLHSYINTQINPVFIRRCEEKHLYRIDPYVIHRRPPGTAGLIRTFVRITFCPIIINDVNNTPNEKLPMVCTQDGVGVRNQLCDYHTDPDIHTSYRVS